MGALYLGSLALPVLAQNVALVGTARDAQQSAMPNVVITLTNMETGVSQSTRTDTEGNYEFQVVRPGSYSLKAQQAGFQTFVQNSFVLRVDSIAKNNTIKERAELQFCAEAFNRRGATWAVRGSCNSAGSLSFEWERKGRPGQRAALCRIPKQIPAEHPVHDRDQVPVGHVRIDRRRQSLPRGVPQGKSGSRPLHQPCGCTTKANTRRTR